MKILILSEFFYGCAAFEIKYLSGKLIAEKGNHVTYVFPSECSLKTKRIKSDVKNLSIIATLGLFPKKFRGGGFSLLDLIIKSKLVIYGNYDIIHTTCGHRPAQLIPALIGKYLKNSIIIDEWWEWFGKGGYSEIRKGPIGKCISLYDIFFELPTKSLFDKVISITHVLKNRLKKNNNVIVLHGGSETDRLIDYELSFARKKINIPENYFIIGMSNLSVDDWDDNKLFFKAFESLSLHFDNIRLFVTGQPEYITSFLSKYTCKDKVIHRGWLSFKDYNYYLSSCNIFVLPFRNIPRNAGRWPNKISDYFAVNRPIITNSTGDLPYLFAKYNLGFICGETSKSFYDQISILIKNSTGLQKSLDSRALALQLSFNKRIDSIINIYRQAKIQKSNDS